MALTPEDVVNKRFQPTKFREGYDQDEVDDFLDEVVVELRRLNQENEELRQRLIASDSRINDLQRSAGAPQQPSYAQPEAAVVAPAPVPVAAPAPAPAYAAGGIDSSSMDPGNTNNLLQLARRLHEEHVREGVEKRDALIAEGHATAARVVADAESKQRASLGALEQERQQLEGRIDELRTFEREYREKLKGYIEGQLRELDSAGNVLPATPAAVTSGTSSPFAEVTAASTSATFADAPAPTYNESPAPTFGEAPQYAAPQPPANFPGFGTS